MPALPRLVFAGALGVSLLAQAPAPVPPAAILQFTQTLDGFGKAGRFAGVALVTQGDKVLLARNHGMADLAHAEPNGPSTRFNLASVGKLFTAVSILQLVQAGKVTLDATVGSYLPDYPNAAVRASVTLRHLLHHASGLDDIFTEAFERAGKERFREPKDFLPLFADKALAFQPGTDFRYSNAGFLVLGLVIEKVSGQSYCEFVQRHVFQPAAMQDSGFFEADEPTKHLAVGYLPNKARPGQWQTNTFLHVVKGGPAGGGYATAADLDRFVRALVGGKLLDARHTKLALTPQPPGQGESYGVMRIKDRTILGHSGGFPGIGASVNHCLETGLTVTLLSNQDRTTWTRLDIAAQRLLAGELPHHADFDFTQSVIALTAEMGTAEGLAFTKAHPEQNLIGPLVQEAAEEAFWEGRTREGNELLALRKATSREDGASGR